MPRKKAIKTRTKTVIRRETTHERIERKKKEYIMAFIRTAANVIGIVVATLGFILNLYVAFHIMLNG